jgi:hypothetical protein
MEKDNNNLDTESCGNIDTMNVNNINYIYTYMWLCACACVYTYIYGILYLYVRYRTDLNFNTKKRLWKMPKRNVYNALFENLVKQPKRDKLIQNF